MNIKELLDKAIEYQRNGVSEKAEQLYRKILAQEPDLFKACYHFANLLQETGRLEEAMYSYEHALKLNPDYEYLLSTKITTQMKLCEWSGLTADLHTLSEKILEHKKVAKPYHLLGLLDNPELQKKAAEDYNKTKFPASQKRPVFHIRRTDEKLRIGYYSAGFREHALSYVMIKRLEEHNKDKIELYGFSLFESNNQDAMRQRISKAFTKFYDVAKMSDLDVALLSRELGIDIAIDLTGYNAHERTAIFANYCAPIQINAIGYPGTMGAPYIDYMITHKSIIQPEDQHHYSEKIIYLPVNLKPAQTLDQRVSREKFGLPEKGFVFCCFNSNKKILPDTFDSWMRILQSIEGSVIWLIVNNIEAIKNLRKEAQNRGVDSSRLVFTKHVSFDEYIALHQLADLFLDTFPYGAHSTANFALLAGLPVLTHKGKAYTSRVASIYLNAFNLSELITKNKNDYELKAIELALDPAALSKIKEKLNYNKLKASLLDSKISTRHLEQAYELIYDRYRNGLSPDNIEIENK